MRLHHIAYVCHDIRQKAKYYMEMLHAKSDEEIIIDAKQGVQILFLELNDGNRIELLQPYGDKSPVQRFLDQGGGLYHLCFEVDDLEVALEEITQGGRAMVVKPPLSAPAVGDRRVAFVVTDQHELIEFVEQESK